MLFGGLLWPFPSTEGTPAAGAGDRQEQFQLSRGQENAGGGRTPGCWKPNVGWFAGCRRAPSPQIHSSAFHLPPMAAWEGWGDTEGPSGLASDVTSVGPGPEPPLCRCCLLPARAAAACLPPLRAPPRGGRVSGPGCRGPQISFKFLPVEVGANPNQLMFAAPCEITAAGQG